LEEGLEESRSPQKQKPKRGVLKWARRVFWTSGEEGIAQNREGRSCRSDLSRKDKSLAAARRKVGPSGRLTPDQLFLAGSQSFSTRIDSGPRELTLPISRLMRRHAHPTHKTARQSHKGKGGTTPSAAQDTWAALTRRGSLSFKCELRCARRQNCRGTLGSSHEIHFGEEAGFSEKVLREVASAILSY